MNILFAFLLATTLIAAPAFAETSAWKIDPIHSGIELKIRHLAVSNVRGTLAIKDGIIRLDEKEITHSSVEATIDAASVRTNEPPRDTHLIQRWQVNPLSIYRVLRYHREITRSKIMH